MYCEKTCTKIFSLGFFVDKSQGKEWGSKKEEGVVRMEW